MAGITVPYENERGRFTPSYVALFESGELARRSRLLVERMASCTICPRECGVNRLQGQLGYCRSPRRPLIASACAHRGEEPPISGDRGSGTIFFANCNLRCIFCQNHQISQSHHSFASQRGSAEALAEIMLALQNEHGCHNINLVSPTHFVPQIVEALMLAAPRGLRLPLVYNTNAYDSVETLRLLAGVVDVYLPDMKYSSDAVSLRLSDVFDYARRSRAAIAEMHRQVGHLLKYDATGTVVRGLIIRHLVLPGGLAGSESSLRWLACSVSNRITLSIMAQYYPAHQAHLIPALGRRIEPSEYRQVIDTAQSLGFEHIWGQESSSYRHYRPDFSRKEHPFE